MKSKRSNVIRLESASTTPRISGHRRGHIVRWSREEGVIVDFPSNPGAPVRALTTIPLTVEDVEQAIAARTEILLTFDDGDPSAPIIVGVVSSPDWLPEPRSNEHGTVALAHESSPHRPTAVADGREVVVEGAERVELRCGKASIILTKAGKILLRGAYISTHSTGANRIRGGSVEIN